MGKNGYIFLKPYKQGQQELFCNRLCRWQSDEYRIFSVERDLCATSGLCDLFKMASYQNAYSGFRQKFDRIASKGYDGTITYDFPSVPIANMINLWHKLAVDFCGVGIVDIKKSTKFIFSPYDIGQYKGRVYTVLKDYDANLGFDISQHGEYRKLMEFNNSGSRTISQPVDERILIVIALMDLLDRAAVEHKEELERLIPGYIFDEDLPNYRPRLSEGHKYVVDIGTDEEKKYLVVENAVLKPLLKVRTAIFDNEEDVEGHRFVIGGWLA